MVSNNPGISETSSQEYDSNATYRAWLPSYCYALRALKFCGSSIRSQSRYAYAAPLRAIVILVSSSIISIF
jgi:hypothetical protein